MPIDSNNINKRMWLMKELGTTVAVVLEYEAYKHFILSS